MGIIDTTNQADFIIKKSNREIELFRKILFDKLCKKLDGMDIEGITVSVLSMDSDKILFDMRGVEGFDHIEFKITQTGWGRSVK